MCFTFSSQHYITLLIRGRLNKYLFGFATSTRTFSSKQNSDSGRVGPGLRQLITSAETVPSFIYRTYYIMCLMTHILCVMRLLYINILYIIYNMFQEYVFPM